MHCMGCVGGEWNLMWSPFVTMMFVVILSVFSGFVSALGRAKFWILQTVGSSAVTLQCISQDPDHSRTFAPLYFFWRDSRFASCSCCLLRRAQTKLRVLSVLWNPSPVWSGTFSQNWTEIKRAELSPHSSAQLAAPSKGLAEWVSCSRELDFLLGLTMCIQLNSMNWVFFNNLHFGIRFFGAGCMMLEIT